MANKSNEVTGWVGWVFFAGFMMILLGFFQSIAGLTAIFNPDWLVVTSDELMVLDLTAWGWAHLIMGVVVLIAGFSVMQGAVWARAVGIVVAMLSAIANLAAINMYPLWAIVIITVDVFVIYALTVHGDELTDV